MSRFVYSTSLTSCSPSGSSVEYSTPAEWFRRGASAYRAGQLTAAVHCFQRGLDLHPGAWAARLDLAKVYEDLGCFNDALYHAEIARSAVPDHPVARRRYERIAEEKRLFDRLATSQGLPTRGVPIQLLGAERLPAPSVELLILALSRSASQLLELLGGRRAQETVRVYLSDVPGAGGPWPWAAGWAESPNRVGLTVPDRQTHPGLLIALLRHELTHLHTLPQAPGLPLWWHEAIAQAYARPLMDWETNLLREESRAGRWVPLEQLNAHLQAPEGATIRRAYRQCAWLGNRMLAAGGWGAVRNCLELAGTTRSLEAIFPRAFGVSPAEFVRECRKRLATPD